MFFQGHKILHVGYRVYSLSNPYIAPYIKLNCAKSSAADVFSLRSSCGAHAGPTACVELIADPAIGHALRIIF